MIGAYDMPSTAQEMLRADSLESFSALRASEVPARQSPLSESANGSEGPSRTAEPWARTLKKVPSRLENKSNEL